MFFFLQVVAHQLIQEKPTMGPRPHDIPSAAMSSGGLINPGSQFNSTESYPPGLNYSFNNPAMLNSGRVYSPSLIGGYAASGGPEISYPNAYDGLGSSVATVRPGALQNFNDYRVSDLRNILDNIRNLQSAERHSSVNIPTMNPSCPASLNAFNGSPFQSPRPLASSSFHDPPYLYRHQ